MNPVFTIGHSTRSIDEFVDLLRLVAPLASARSTSCCEMLPKRPAGLEAWYAACAAPPSPPPSFAPPPQATRPIAIAESIVSRVKRVMRTPFLIEDLAPRPGREA